MTTHKSEFQLTPTMWEFSQSPAPVRLLAGPVGSGKSVCCSHELVRMAMQQKPNKDGLRKSRTLIVRNTADQLRSTTQKTFFDWFPNGLWGHWKVGDRTFYMDHRLMDGTQLQAEFMFMPLDTPDDVRKALSLELTFVWCNEWREIHPEVVDGLLMRLKRYPSMKDGGFTRSCAIFDTNMPDMDSWHFHMMEEPPKTWEVFVQPPAILAVDEYINQEHKAPDPSQVFSDDRNKEWVVNPQADNIANLDPTYYPENVPGKTEDFINVYLRCRYGRSLAGLPVYDKTFSPDFHIAKEPFVPLKSKEYPVVVGLDFGRTPAAALCQRNVYGQLVVLAEATSVNMGIETFLATKLRPLMAEKRFAGCHFLVAPDPAGWSKQQVGELSPVDVLLVQGFEVARPMTNSPELRIQCVERFLSTNIGGKPGLIVNPECSMLLKAFKFGYRFRLSRKGITDKSPDKNEFSHISDALQYACLVAESNQIRQSGLGVARRREVRLVSWAA